MKRPLLLLALLSAALPAAAQERPGGDRDDGAFGRGRMGPAPRGYANPSAVIAAELALSRDAATRGETTALAAAAAPEAVVFTPKLAWAHTWLKTRANPPAAPRWQPRAVWSSCDGALVFSRGDWTDTAGHAGWYTRLWQRQEDGAYKWLAATSGPLAKADAEFDMIAAEVADCPARKARGLGDEPRKRDKPPKPVKVKNLPAIDPLQHGGASPDGSLRWEVRVDAGGGAHLEATWRKGGVEQALPSGALSPPPNLR